MAKSKGKSVRVDLDFIPRLTNKINQKNAQYDKLTEQRVRRATQMVWAIAHQKRPMISNAQAKVESRFNPYVFKIGKNKYKKVSDPNAQLGVPVDSGVLQASIVQTVTRTKLMGFQGKVETKGVDYANAIEFGDGKIRPRPFMRPAINLTRDAIKRMFGLKVGSNL